MPFQCNLCGRRHNPDSDLQQLESRIRLGETDLLHDYCQYRQNVGSPLSLWDLISLAPDPIIVVKENYRFGEAWNQIKRENKYPVSLYPIDTWNSNVDHWKWQLMIPGYGGDATGYLPAAIIDAYKLMHAAKYFKSHWMLLSWLAPKPGFNTPVLVLHERAVEILKNYHIKCTHPEDQYDSLALSSWMFIFE